MKNKAQVQIMDTISIMLIFFIIIVIGFLFYLRVSSSSQIDKLSKAQELESIRVSQTISFLPELQCSSKNIVKDNCFDKYKLDMFKMFGTAKKDQYYPFFYYSNITINEIYPNSGNWNIYSKIGNGTSYKTFIPILLYNPITKTNAFGILTVQSYARD